MSETRESVVWQHGYGVHKNIDRLSRAASKIAADEEPNIALTVPELSDWIQTEERAYIITPPLSVQVERFLTAFRNNLNITSLVSHSQGGWVMGEAMRRDPSIQPEHVTMLVPALSDPTERLERELNRNSYPHEERMAEMYGGAFGVKRWVSQGRENSLVIPEGYMAEISSQPFPWLTLIAIALHRAPHSRVIQAGADERFGPLTEEYQALKQAAPDTAFEVMPEATHMFRGKERQVARAALTRCQVVPENV